MIPRETVPMHCFLAHQLALLSPCRLQALLNNGADTAARDKGGNPPLHYAAGCVGAARLRAVAAHSSRVCRGGAE